MLQNNNAHKLRLQRIFDGDDPDEEPFEFEIGDTNSYVRVRFATSGPLMMVHRVFVTEHFDNGTRVIVRNWKEVGFAVLENYLDEGIMWCHENDVEHNLDQEAVLDYIRESLEAASVD